MTSGTAPRAWRRRAARTSLALVGLLVLGPLSCRAASAFRERGSARELAPDEGHFVETPSGALFVEELGSPVGPTVVLVPGTMAWSGTYVDLAQRLSDAGARVIALDLPPFGYSERPSDGDYGRVAGAARIDALLDALELDDVVLVGHSFGAGPTLEAAMRRRDRVTQLVLLDGALGLGDGTATPRPTSLPWWLGAAPMRDVVASCTLANPPMIPVGLRAFVADDALVTDARVAIYARPLAVEGAAHGVGAWLATALFRDETRAASGPEAALRAYDAPVLLVWGRQDDVTPLAQGEHLASLLPHAELVVLDGVDHVPHVEAPDRTAEAILRFMRAATPSPAP